MGDAWHLVVAYGPGIAVVITGLWTAGTWLYMDRQQRSAAAAAEKHQREQAFEIAIRESQRPFLERQLAFYFEATKVTGKLATLSPGQSAVNQAKEVPEDWAWARRRFWELYWGELAVVESPEVAGAMVQFGNRLRELEKCVDGGESCHPLTGASIELAHQIRDSIQKGWGYSLPEIRR